MTDTLSPTERSAQMRLVKSKDTRPEIVVRKLCRDLKHRGYRLHRKDLAGKPDITFVGRKVAVFVHGCFWHGHDCSGRIRLPKSKQDYWLPKIKRNRDRDAKNLAILTRNGWRVLIVWECETKRVAELTSKLAGFLA
jgi:DNA mismatch endonuclease (patch repair protein)